MKILVFGKTGQVATQLQRFKNVQAVDRDQVDLTDPERVMEMIMKSDVDAVINAAAYTAVDQAESEEAQAMAINCDAPKVMAQAAAKKGIPFVQISTDYVFNGKGSRPWLPTDIPAPLGAYGKSKLAGEIAIREAGGTHAILRTSWVFSATGNNFVKTMLRLGQERDELSIVADQIGGPTSAAALANACYKVSMGLVNHPEKSGVYHFSGAPNISWAGFAREIFAQANLAVQVNEIPTSEFPTPAPRPKNSRLNCRSIKEIFDISQPDWRIDLTKVLADLPPGQTCQN